MAMSSSTFGNPNHFAGYLAMALPVCLAMFLTGLKKSQVILTGVITLLISMAIVFALARGGWISSIFGVAFMGVVLLLSSKRNPISKKVPLLIGGGLFLIGVVFLFSTPAVEEAVTLKKAPEDANLQQRILVWRHTVQMIPDYPLLGSGPGTYATIFTQYQPPGILSRYYMAHNDYLHFVSETGLPVLVIMGWLIDRRVSMRIEKIGAPESFGEGLHPWGLVRNFRHFALQCFRLQPPHSGQCGAVFSACSHRGFTAAQMGRTLSETKPGAWKCEERIVPASVLRIIF